MHSGKRRSIVGLTFSSPHSFHSGGGSQRLEAVKGAPFFGAAQRTLDGENRCETITEGRKEPSFHSTYPLQSPNSLLFTGICLIVANACEVARIISLDQVRPAGYIA
jgi:hypothetical protein